MLRLAGVDRLLAQQGERHLAHFTHHGLRKRTLCTAGLPRRIRKGGLHWHPRLTASFVGAAILEHQHTFFALIHQVVDKCRCLNALACGPSRCIVEGPAGKRDPSNVAAKATRCCTPAFASIAIESVSMSVLAFCSRLQRTGIHPILIILMAVAGVILLLPGVCAAGFMVLGGLRRKLQT